MGGSARRLGQALRLQFPPAFQVDLTPVALRFPRGKANRVAGGVKVLTDTINPAVTERVVERLLIGDATLARFCGVKTEQQLGFRCVMPLEPRTKLIA